MSVGGKKDDYDFCREEDDLEWWAEHRMNIREVRMIYSSLTHYSNIWEKWNGDRLNEKALSVKIDNFHILQSHYSNMY